jgi:hypothetical protein
VIRLSDYPDREWVGYLQQGPSRASAIGPAWITRAEGVVLQWSIPDPTGRGQVEISQVPGALALGTAPSPLRVEVQNGGVAPITRVVVEAFRQELRNPGFEEPNGAYWTQGTGISYLSDPEVAYSGRGYCEVVATSGSRDNYQRDEAGRREIPVEPGDIVEVGTRSQRLAGDGLVEVVGLIQAANDSYLAAALARPPASATDWLSASASRVVPPTGAFVRFAARVFGATTPTTARFDDVYLRVLRQSEPRRILEWNGVIAPGALWECDAEIFRVLNGGANAIDGLTPASEFPVASAGEGGYGYVLVTITGGGGHQTTVRYRRRWL